MDGLALAVDYGLEQSYRTIDPDLGLFLSGLNAGSDSSCFIENKPNHSAKSASWNHPPRLLLAVCGALRAHAQPLLMPNIHPNVDACVRRVSFF